MHEQTGGNDSIRESQKVASLERYEVLKKPAMSTCLLYHTAMWFPDTGPMRKKCPFK